MSFEYYDSHRYLTLSNQQHQQQNQQQQHQQQQQQHQQQQQRNQYSIDIETYNEQQERLRQQQCSSFCQLDPQRFQIHEQLQQQQQYTSFGRIEPQRSQIHNSYRSLHNRSQSDYVFNKEKNNKRNNNSYSRKKNQKNSINVNPTLANGGAGANLMPLDWNTQNLIPKIINEYQEHPEVTAMTPEYIQRLYKDMEILVSGISPPKPIMELYQTPFPKWIVDIMLKLGFTKPYPVQSVGWPAVLQSRDIIGIAKTGSGKTLAYLLPGILHIQKQPNLRQGDGPLVLILAPTRELAMQIEKEARKFSASSSSFAICVYGGVPRSRQAAALLRGVQICIATPGRLLDFLDAGVTNLRRVTYLVIDEADRMLDMGFEIQIRRIVSQIRPDRQTLMWSATWPTIIQKLARDLCRTAPIKLTVGSHELQANENIQQHVEVCTSQERFTLVVRFLQQIFHRENGIRRKVLIFCETKIGCDILCDKLRRFIAHSNNVDLYSIMTIHGDKEQSERDRALHNFKYGNCDVLIATDVASRGLDIKGIDLVINYDIPKTIECYIHRIGRTGRAGAQGTAISLLSDAVSEVERIRMAKEIATVIRDVGQTPSLALIHLATEKNFKSRTRGHGRKIRGGSYRGGSYMQMKNATNI